MSTSDATPVTALAERFRALHSGDAPLLMPNAWDVGSAKVLASFGFAALGTTSIGAAAARGRTDGGLDRDAALGAAGELADGVEVPVSADLEDCFADTPDGVAETVRRAAGLGLAGASVEDWHGGAILDRGAATERVAAAAEVARSTGLVLTARAENHMRGHDDLDDTVARLRAYQEAGADVVFAPGVRTADQIRAVVEAVDVPVNVLVLPDTPPVAELATLGVSRISVGGAFAFAAYGALADAARELQTEGTYGYWGPAQHGFHVAATAFGLVLPDR